MAHEAIWRSRAGRVALVHAFLGALRVVCDPRAIAPNDPTAAVPSGAKGGPYKTTRAGNKANAASGHANEAFEGAGKVLIAAAATLGRLFIFAAGAGDTNIVIGNRAVVPAAAAEMVEELLRGDCLPMLSRLLASCIPRTPSAFKATADDTSLLFDMVYFMLLVGVSQPHTRGLVLSPQLPACRLMELWARAAAIEAPPAPHGNHESSSDPERPVLSLGPRTDDGMPLSFARSMRRSLGLPLLLRHRSEGGEPLRAVLSGPCLQYLVALRAVSQLHAADGGTLYGLPPAAALPPELAAAEGRGGGGGGRRQGPHKLSCGALTECLNFWESCVTGQPRVPLGPLRNRCLVNLCMRLSRVALASLDGVEGTATAAPIDEHRPARRQHAKEQGQWGKASGSSSSGDNDGGGGGGGGSGSGGAAGVSFAHGVALRQSLEASKCPSVALQSLQLAAAVLRGQEADPNRKTVSCVCSSNGGGSAGRNHDHLKTPDRSAPSCCTSVDGSSDGSCISCSSGGGMPAASPSITEGGGSPGVTAVSPTDGPPAAPEPSADPRLCSRSFGRRWWPLAVGAVRAALRQPGGMEEETLKRCCSVLSVSAWCSKERDPQPDAAEALVGMQSDEPACSTAAHHALGSTVRREEDSEQHAEGRGRAGRVTPEGQPRRDPVPLYTIPPGLAVALAAGLLPTLTALVRSSCGAASGPLDAVDMADTSLDALTAALNLSGVYRAASCGELLLLLSHADPAQATALLTALAKASLRLTSFAADPRSDGLRGCAIMLLVVHFSSAFCCLMSGFLPWEEVKWGLCAWAWPCGDGGDSGGVGPAEAEAVAPAYRQMLRLASFVLHTWLPVLARMYDLAAKPHVPREGHKPQDVPVDKQHDAASDQRFLKGHLQRAVRLAARACRAAWRKGDARAVGSWRQLLQRNVCAARWLGPEVVAGWEAEGWWSGAVEQQQQGAGQQGRVAAGAGGNEQQQGEEGKGQAGGGVAGSEEEEEEAWPYPLPLAPCESVALLRT